MNDFALAKIDEARLALAEAKNAPEAKQIRDQAEALRVYIKQRDGSLEALNYAAELKLRAERRIGEIQREEPKARGTRGDFKGRNVSGGALKIPPEKDAPTLEDKGLSKKQSAAWQKLAKMDEGDFEGYIAESKEAEAEITTSGALRAAKGEKLAVHFSSDEHDWGTPSDFFSEISKEFKFKTDVCASKWNAKCKKFYTKESNGLEQDWHGVCWMNPPYGSEIVNWVRKAHESSKNGATVVCLVPARVDTAWWWDYCTEGEIRFIRGRLRFERQGEQASSAPFPSAIVIFEKGRRRATRWDK